MNKGFPTKQEAIGLLQRYVLLSNVEEHCVSVATFGVYLAEKIKEKKLPNLNIDVVFITSLFHDLLKSSTVKELDHKKYDFKELTEDQTKRWKILRKIALSIQELYDDMNEWNPTLQKKVHETDVAIILIGSLFPDLVQFIQQTGGTRNPIYLTSGPEIKIMHYADWRMQRHNLVDFNARIEYNFGRYWSELPQEQKKERKKAEFELEKELFEGLDITPDVNIEELNKKKTELFDGKYDYFKIGKDERIE